MIDACLNQRSEHVAGDVRMQVYPAHPCGYAPVVQERHHQAEVVLGLLRIILSVMVVSHVHVPSKEVDHVGVVTAQGQEVGLHSQIIRAHVNDE